MAHLKKELGRYILHVTAVVNLTLHNFMFKFDLTQMVLYQMTYHRHLFVIPSKKIKVDIIITFITVF